MRCSEILSFIDNSVRVLNCLCLQCKPDDPCDHTVSTNVHPDESIDAEEDRYAVIIFESISLGHGILGSNFCVSPYTSQFSWPLHWFSVYSFY